MPTSQILGYSYILLSLIVALMGFKKTMGFSGALLICLTLTPVFGFIVMFFYAPSKDETEDYQKT